MRSRRSRRSLKLSHTQTSVPYGTLKYFFSLNLCLEISIKIIIKEGGGVLLIFIYLCFFFFVCFNSLTVTTKKNYPDFFFFFLWVGPGQRKKLLISGKDLDHILDTKNREFSKIPFFMYF